MAKSVVNELTTRKGMENFGKDLVQKTLTGAVSGLAFDAVLDKKKHNAEAESAAEEAMARQKRMANLLMAHNAADATRLAAHTVGDGVIRLVRPES